MCEYEQNDFVLFPYSYGYIYGEPHQVTELIKDNYGQIYEELDADGTAFMVDSDIFIYLCPSVETWQEILVHECVHATWFLNEKIGELFSEKSSHLQCYLAQRIFKDGVEFFKGKYASG